MSLHFEVIVVGGGHAGCESALAAARMLVKHTELSGPEIVKEALTTAGEICIYTNTNIVLEQLGAR